jgi:hypothetical protein
MSNGNKSAAIVAGIAVGVLAVGVGLTFIGELFPSKNRNDGIAVDKPVYYPSPPPVSPLVSESADGQFSDAENEQEGQRRYEDTSDPYPFTAVMTCGVSGFEHINLMACMGGRVGSEIELRNGDSYGLYKIHNIPNEWQQTDRGVEVPLTNNFTIKMQNSSESLIMGLRVFDNNGNILFQQQVSQWGVIAISN